MKFSALLTGAIAICMAAVSADENASTTVTVTTAYPATYTNGRFNNTHGEESTTTTSTGTHTDGRFNNTHGQSEPTTTSSSEAGTLTKTKFTSSPTEKAVSTNGAAAGPKIMAVPGIHGNAVVGMSLAGAGVIAVALLM
ncbi:DEKNAAC101941 [Brettanomyces naardenensis]|uniref:DEKNAAC101941 n=1 Tax=Brettanomyces naardenensis TaxID=13370 RepID=A0A448YJE3_BRENA|nr:DEKNAAC101941 [Brettanomyces naardenensis]